MRPVWTPLFIALVACLTAGCASRVVVGSIAPGEAQRCRVALGAAGLDAFVERDDAAGETACRVVVRGDDADYRAALRVLEERGLPRREVSGFAAAPASLIPSPVEERARFIKGLSSEVEALIESIDGVASAEVLVSIPERRPLGPQAPVSASAVVAHSGDESPVGADEVRSIVVSAVGAEIDAANVAVVLKPVVRSSMAPPAVRYERDRIVELGFLGSVAALVALEVATLWMLRAKRREAARHDGGEKRNA